jgi:hypothetical protein
MPSCRHKKQASRATMAMILTTLPWPFNTQTQTVFDGKLNENGIAINTDINVEKQAPGQLRANFVVKYLSRAATSAYSRPVWIITFIMAMWALKPPKGSDLSGMLVTDKDT